MGYNVNALQSYSTAIGRSFTNSVSGTFAVGFGQKDFVVGPGYALLPRDNSYLGFGAGTGGDARISYDGTNMIFESNSTTQNSIAIFSSNVSVQNIIDRSWYWDNKLGNSLDFVKDSQSINSDKDLHPFEQATYQITDKSRPVNISYGVEVCEEEVTVEICEYKEDGKDYIYVCKNQTIQQLCSPFNEEICEYIEISKGKFRKECHI